MPKITLPDGSVRRFDRPLNGLELAESIGKGLARDAVAIRLDGELRDLATVIDADAGVAIITRNEPDGLDVLRHDAAHVLAEAVKELHPGTQVTIGPTIENGFYYDFARDEPFTPDDLERIEERMREIVARDETVHREVWDRSEAMEFFRGLGRNTRRKSSRASPRASRSRSIAREASSILCRGPHLPSTGRLGAAFKLTSVAGAYWRGIRATPCCNGSTAPRGRTRRRCAPTCGAWRKPSGGTTAGSGAR